jgi:hypothetical protein
MPYPDVVRWVSVSRASGGKTVAAADHPVDSSYVAAGLQPAKPRQSSKDFVYLFTFLRASNAGILVTIFACFQSHICECFN